jgi:hypothetical protein
MIKFEFEDREEIKNFFYGKFSGAPILGKELRADLIKRIISVLSEFGLTRKESEDTWIAQFAGDTTLWLG